MSAAFNQRIHKVLVVDDDIDLLMLLERRLIKEGFVIETAASLQQAEEVHAFFEPHLVLLDINVKGEDGRQFCWKLKHHTTTPAAKVLLMSGYDCSISRAVLFGADGVIAKPIQFEYLLHCMQQQLQPGTVPSPLFAFKDNLG